MIDKEKMKEWGDFISEERKGMVLYRVGSGVEEKKGKVFLVDRKKTIEVRTDEKLGRLLRGKYESVMESRYFGRGGIEVVLSGQLDEGEVRDLIRLSYELSKKMAE